MKRSLVIVLDSVGCGQAPDAARFGDQGTNTLGHLYQRIPDFRLPNLESIGLAEILDLPTSPIRKGFSGHRLTSHGPGKDTTSGHWELMGHILVEPFATFHTFPNDLLDELTRRSGHEFLGNHPASGTDIIRTLGPLHVETKKPILYTSADSVMQIAAHEEHFGLPELMELCRTARTILDERNIRIGRVIARPFTGDAVRGFSRTSNRHDFSIAPGETALDRLQKSGVTTVGIGKIADIFANSGIDQSHPTTSNLDGMRLIQQLWRETSRTPHFIFANLVDFDALYGHRRDPAGYARCLIEFDHWLGEFLETICPEDQLILTADHGNDPYHSGTDHTREQVPLLIHQPNRINQPSRFSDVAESVESYFDRT